MGRIRIVGSIVDAEIIKEFTSPKIQADLNTQDFLYLKGRIMTCDETNANGDHFPKTEVKANYESFIGGIVDYNHNQDMILGKIIDAVYCEGKTIESADGKKETGLDYVEIICKINKKAFVDIVAQIEAGILHQMSLEAYADEAECSICAHNFNFMDVAPCDHIQGGLMRKLKGADGVEKLVYKIDKKLTFTGAGIVPNPADKRADINTVIANDNKVESKDETCGECGGKNDKESGAYCRTCNNTGKVTKKEEEKIESVESDTLDSALKKLNAYEFLSILKSVENKFTGKTKTIAMDIMKENEDVMTEKEFYEILSKKYDKLSTLEIEDIKNTLKANKKLLNNEFSAHLLTDDGENYWMIYKNDVPMFKKKISDIYGEDWNKSQEIDGVPLKEYAVSSTFKKRLLSTIQTEGVDYLKNVWEIDEPVVVEETNLLTELKMLASKLKINITSEEIINALFNGAGIQASETLYIRDKFCKCVKDNANNESIKAKKNQSKTDSVEVFCYNKLAASTIKAGIKETNLFNLMWNILGRSYSKAKLKASEKVASWLEYKVMGKWHKEISKKLLSKTFAIEASDNLKEYRDTSFINLGFTQEFVDMFGVLASKKDVEKLFGYGLTAKEITQLFKERFGF